VDGRIQAMDLPDADSTSEHLPTLLQVMQSNHERFLQSIREDVARMVERHLFELDGGPGFLAEALKQYLRAMEQWAVDAQRNLGEYR
jgi:hypothetical protein